jgi:hypothetical protein
MQTFLRFTLTALLISMTLSNCIDTLNADPLCLKLATWGPSYISTSGETHTFSTIILDLPSLTNNNVKDTTIVTKLQDSANKIINVLEFDYFNFWKLYNTLDAEYDIIQVGHSYRFQIKTGRSNVSTTIAPKTILEYTDQEVMTLQRMRNSFGCQLGIDNKNHEMIDKLIYPPNGKGRDLTKVIPGCDDTEVYMKTKLSDLKYMFERMETKVFGNDEPSHVGRLHVLLHKTFEGLNFQPDEWDTRVMNELDAMVRNPEELKFLS